MTRSLPRITAAIVLTAAGALIAISAFALVVARAVISLRPDLAVRPSDLALLNDLVPLTPFITTFAVVNLVAAVALLTGRAWADRLATAIATVATSLGAFAFVLVALGHDPFTAPTAMGSVADGLAIIGAFTAVYVAVVVALAFASEPDSGTRPAGAFSLPAAA
jgi:hypothetical protein